MSKLRDLGAITTVGDIKGNPQYPIIITSKDPRGVDEFVKHCLESKDYGLHNELPFFFSFNKENMKNI